jgi:hypothetical protein
MSTQISGSFRFAFFLLAPALAVGCDSEKLVQITGTVTRHGQPVPRLVINFSPEKGMQSYALTAQDGRFDMMHTTGQEGVVMGMHKVWVQLPTAGSKEDKGQQKRLAKQQSDPEIAQILRKYGRVETTPLTVEAKEDREFNIVLD